MKIFAVNVLGPTLLATAALPQLALAKGTIINVSSTYGHKPVAGLSHYAASKAALEHLTRCWALELAPHGVRVNAIAAGPTESGALTGMMGLTPEQAAAIKEQEREQIPLKRRGNPNDVGPVDRVARRSGFRMGDGTGDRRRWRPGARMTAMRRSGSGHGVAPRATWHQAVASDH